MLHSSNLLFFWSSSHPSVAFSAGDPSNSASADDFSDMVLLPANEDRKKRPLLQVWTPAEVPNVSPANFPWEGGTLSYFPPSPDPICRLNHWRRSRSRLPPFSPLFLSHFRCGVLATKPSAVACYEKVGGERRDDDDLHTHTTVPAGTLLLSSWNSCLKGWCDSRPLGMSKIIHRILQSFCEHMLKTWLSYLLYIRSTARDRINSIKS